MRMILLTWPCAPIARTAYIGQLVCEGKACESKEKDGPLPFYNRKNNTKNNIYLQNRSVFCKPKDCRVRPRSNEINECVYGGLQERKDAWVYTT